MTAKTAGSMSRSFTFVPDNIVFAAEDLLRRVAIDPGVIIRIGDISEVFFAGSAEVVKAAGDQASGLACIRILGSGVFHVDLDGYEGSVEHALRYLRFALVTFHCRVFDDVTGDDLTAAAQRNPEILLSA